MKNSIYDESYVDSYEMPVDYGRSCTDEEIEQLFAELTDAMNSNDVQKMDCLYEHIRDFGSNDDLTKAYNMIEEWQDKPHDNNNGYEYFTDDEI